MDRLSLRRRLIEKPTGHLATVGPNSRPHVVVVTFALTDESIVTAIDHKPKTTSRLKRLTNLEHNPRASFLVDHYDDDWSVLWWVRVDGPATIHHDGAQFDEALAALQLRYQQYRENPPEGPVISLAIEDISSWESTP